MGWNAKVWPVRSGNSDTPQLVRLVMDASLVLVPVCALGASLLTFVSGFGLGTLLLPVFALFYPLEVAVLLTAVVHVLNNLFKLGLLLRSVDRQVLLRFGLPGILGAIAGAFLLRSFGSSQPWYNGVFHPVGAQHLVIATLMLVFGWLELARPGPHRSFGPEWLVPGGLLSGFFGGLSGHQGALRSLFLLRSGLDERAFIATGVAIACLVDLTRLPIYLTGTSITSVCQQWPLLLITVCAAFAGAWWGKMLLPKVTIRIARIAVGCLMVAIAGMLVSGLI